MKQLKFSSNKFGDTFTPMFTLHFNPWDRAIDSLGLKTIGSFSPLDYPDLDTIKHLFYTELKLKKLT